MLTREAWNALLKILEEPPPRVVFVFATTEPQKIAQAAAPVLSRLQRFDFRRIGPADVRARLAAGARDGARGVRRPRRSRCSPAPPTARCATRSASRTRRSRSARARSPPERVREALGLIAEDEYLAIYDLIARRDAAAIFPAVARLVDEGADLGAFLGGLADILRAALALALGDPTGGLAELSDRTREALARAQEPARLGRPAAHAERDHGARAALPAQRTAADARGDDARAIRADGSHGVARGSAARAGSGRWRGSRRALLRRRGRSRRRRSSHARRRAKSRKLRARSGRIALVTASSSCRGELAPLTSPPSDRWNRVGGCARTDDSRSSRRSSTRRPPRCRRPARSPWSSRRTPITCRSRSRTPAASCSAAIAPRARGWRRACACGCPRHRPCGMAPTRRLTAESVKAERLSSLRRRDPALDAAVRELDLELMD